MSPQVTKGGRFAASEKGDRRKAVDEVVAEPKKRADVGIRPYVSHRGGIGRCLPLEGGAFAKQMTEGVFTHTGG